MAWRLLRIAARAKRCRAASAVESLLAVLVLLLVFFGLLQLIQISVANLIVRYSAFSTARTASVGFNDDLVLRSAIVSAIPALGPRLDPQPSTNDMQKLLIEERAIIPQYIAGTRDDLYYAMQGRYSVETKTDGELLTLTNTIENYRIDFGLWDLLRQNKPLDIQGEATLVDHASFFLDY